MIGFYLLARDGAARRGRLATAFGMVETPAFMPVGTAATVKAVTFDMVAATGAEIVLANTYHLMLRPGAERIGRLGGLHRFMRWNGPILTDSGGYQVMSLAERRKLDEPSARRANSTTNVSASRMRLRFTCPPDEVPADRSRGAGTGAGRWGGDRTAGSGRSSRAARDYSTATPHGLSDAGRGAASRGTADGARE